MAAGAAEGGAAAAEGGAPERERRGGMLSSLSEAVVRSMTDVWSWTTPSAGAEGAGEVGACPDFLRSCLRSICISAFFCSLSSSAVILTPAPSIMGGTERPRLVPCLALPPSLAGVAAIAGVEMLARLPREGARALQEKEASAGVRKNVLCESKV